jgi:hypothetical protein
MTLPTPDLKPHVPPAAPGSAGCGCCDGIAVATPQALYNRGGLSAIGYRVGEHAQFRASLHAWLSSSAYAPLAALRTRDDADFTIGLIDAFACAADVFTFYQERIANESYLRTATERVSLQEMGKLIGYRLRPGVAAETWLAFALDTPPTPPPTLPPEPGNFITGIPDQLTLAAGLKVQSVPGPDEVPQTFETAEALLARPAWNAMRALADEDRVPRFGARETWLAGTATQLRAGDTLLFVGPQFAADSNSNRWDARVLTKVEPDDAHARTRVAWAEPLGSVAPFMQTADPPTIHALRDRAAIFGHNAVSWATLSDDFKRGVLGLPAGTVLSDEQRAQWPGFDIFQHGGRVLRTIGLDREYTGIVAGSYALLSKPDYLELYRVEAVAHGARAQFALSGRTSWLTLAGQNLALFAAAVRETTVHARSEVLARARAPIQDPVSGSSLRVAAAVAGLQPGRLLLVKGERSDGGGSVVHLATLVSATPAALAADGGTLVIDPPLPWPLERGSTVVHGNVALASHGECVAQILGAGDSAQAFQRFELKQLPLTHRAAGNELGAAAELTVRVGEVAWTERPTLYGASATERSYTLASDEQGRQFVAFGDGVRGARLPSGVNNVRAAYRKGLGAAGNVRAQTLTQLMTRPLGLKSVANPLAAEGGTDPEAADAARQSMPLATRTLGRAVSLLDYEDYARAYSGIAKAQAQVLNLRAGRSVCITLAASAGGALSSASPVWTHLLAALKASGDPHVPVQLLACQTSSFHLGLRVKRDPAFAAPAVLAAVEAALRAAFSFDARALAQPVQQSEVIAVAQGVPGVVAVDLTHLYGGTRPALQTRHHGVPQQRLLAARMRVQDGVALPAELLTLAATPLDLLEEMQ